MGMAPAHNHFGRRVIKGGPISKSPIKLSMNALSSEETDSSFEFLESSA